MNTVNVRKVEIGKGIPKICVPVVGITRDDIIDAACKAKETADLVEWRADWYEDVLDFKKTEKMMEELRETLGDIATEYPFGYRLRRCSVCRLIQLILNDGGIRR
jgi:3-dehydroquinate dehydratase-1